MARQRACWKVVTGPPGGPFTPPTSGRRPVSVQAGPRTGWSPMVPGGMDGAAFARPLPRAMDGVPGRAAGTAAFSGAGIGRRDWARTVKAAEGRRPRSRADLRAFGRPTARRQHRSSKLGPGLVLGRGQTSVRASARFADYSFPEPAITTDKGGNSHERG